MRKKKWITPKITVLIRRVQQENILATCKTRTVGASSDTNTAYGGRGCMINDGETCSWCAMAVSS